MLTTTTISEALLFGAIYVAVATAIHAGVVLLAGTVQPLLTIPARRRTMGAVFALLLVGVALWVTWSTAL